MPALDNNLIVSVRRATNKGRSYFLGAKTSSFALSPGDCYGGLFTNEGATGPIVVSLPPAKAGMSVRVHLLAAQEVTFDPYGSDRILIYTDANGDAIKTPGVVGSRIELFCVEDGKWMSDSEIGFWLDVN